MASPKKSKLKSNRWLQTIHSDGSEEFISPLRYHLGDEVTFRIRLHKESSVDKMIFRSIQNGQEQGVEMKKEKESGHLAYYSISIKIWTQPFHYRFKIIAGDKIYHYNALGVQSFLPADKDNFKICADFNPPSWLWDRVFYQIYPDRFFDGDPSTNVKDGEYAYHGHPTIARKWGELPGEYPNAFSLDFFGGDLKGIQQKIPYLKRLGVNALWLNPIFLSPSNHKYDTQDYKTIDPHIGSDKDLRELVEALHKEDIRVILDGVFNHTGSSHLWFNRDELYDKPGAWQDPDGTYRDYYLSFGDKNFHYWAGFSTLPTLNYRSRKLRDEIYGAADSVAQRYVKPPFSTDGWRLDVADTVARQDAIQLHREVWPEFRSAVKQANPDAYVMGECGAESTEILQGDGLDGAMNYYGFATPVRQWLTGQIVFEGDAAKKRFLDAADLKNWLMNSRSTTSHPVALSMYNLLSSHDCSRFLHHCEGDARMLKAALTLMFGYVGVPALYYGDEVGLRGSASNESARCCMEWNEKKWDRELFEFVQTLISVRKKSAALQRGGIRSLGAQDNVFSFARFLKNENWIVVLNGDAKKKKIKLDLSALALFRNEILKDAVTGKSWRCNDHFLSLDLPPYGAMLLRGETKK